MKKTEHANAYRFSPETMEIPQPFKFWVDLAALQTRLATSYWDGFYRGVEEVYNQNLKELTEGNRKNETT